jgi:PIN domain nuclease of toxin-antitoxin system
MAAAPLLFDTHYWLWAQGATTGRISARDLKAIRFAAQTGDLLLSVISVWEIGILAAKGRINLFLATDQWVKTALAMPGLTLVTLTPEIALDSTQLPGILHGDPADRIIVATARAGNARLLTADEKLAAWCRKNGVALA